MLENMAGKDCCSDCSDGAAKKLSDGLGKVICKLVVSNIFCSP